MKHGFFQLPEHQLPKNKEQLSQCKSIDEDF